MSKVTDYLKIVTEEEVKDFVVIHFGESWTLWVKKCILKYRNEKIIEKNIEMCSTHNERKSVVIERFNKTLKKKIYECMTGISKNVYINK